MYKLITIFFILLTIESNISFGEKVVSLTNIIESKSNETSKLFCILDFVLDVKNWTKEQKRNEFYPMENLYDSDELEFCRNDFLFTSGPFNDNINRNITNKFVLINYSKECDVNQQINYFSKYSIYGLFISIGCNVDIDSSIIILNKTLFDNKFSVSLITQSSVESLLGLHLNQIKLFDIKSEESFVGFDFSIVLIWILATFTVVLGAFWSGSVRLQIFRFNHQKITETTAERDSKETTSSAKPVEEAFLNVSPFLIVFFVLMMALMLLALYYFFQYLVYVIIFLFTMASMASIFACGEPIILRVFPEHITSKGFTFFTVRCGKMYFYQLILLVFSVGLSLTWLIARKESYSWILQDLLGICFSLNMLRTIRLPSYKICVILLSLLFFYDIFFVFITPLITSKGNSVMVDVATGGSGKSRCGKPGEQIPMVIRIPHSQFRTNTVDPFEVCYPNRDSILGFGDILVPGLLVSYCYAFDLIFGVKYRIYYITSSICYGLGLIATFAGLYLMSGSAQPALLYLVPFTTIPPILIALYRKEFKQLWSGPESHINPSVAAIKTDTSIEDDNLLIGESQTSVPSNK